MSGPLPPVRHFRKPQDPRLNRRKPHSPEAIPVITAWAVRGSASPGDGLGCLHLVNVRATRANPCPGLAACGADSNGIAAIPRLLALLDLGGAPVTSDAAGRQEEIAQQVVDGGGDHLLVVQGGQGGPHEEIRGRFERAAEQGGQLAPATGRDLPRR